MAAGPAGAVSSDRRLKKLRGSGGYVMADVDDGQQRKGNLGGPDLFLAPVGRLDPESITKYFCNACEKGYEGAPKIDYESPNEEVADNLVLSERGQYSCGECGSTIAEYREFTKPDEQGEVGLARPEAAAPQAEAPAAAAPAGAPPAAAAGARPVAGMAVYDEGGARVGTAGQLCVDASRKLVLPVGLDGGGEEAVPWERVSKVGEIVLLGPAGGPASPPGGGQGAQGPPAEAPAGAACPACAFSNRPGSKFCEQCGSKV